MPSSKPPKYIARLFCEGEGCENTTEVDAEIEAYFGGGYSPMCEHELSHSNPEGWLGGYEAGYRGNGKNPWEPLLCPACVEKKYA